MKDITYTVQGGTPTYNVVLKRDGTTIDTNTHGADGTYLFTDIDVSGTYTIEVTDANNCFVSQTVEVNIPTTTTTSTTTSTTTTTTTSTTTSTTTTTTTTAAPDTFGVTIQLNALGVPNGDTWNLTLGNTGFIALGLSVEVGGITSGSEQYAIDGTRTVDFSFTRILQQTQGGGNIEINVNGGGVEYSQGFFVGQNVNSGIFDASLTISPNDNVVVTITETNLFS